MPKRKQDAEVAQAVLTWQRAQAPRLPALQPHPATNVAWTVVGNVVYAASQWAMLVVIAKLGDARMLGHFALGLALVTPVTMFSNLQLRSVQATDAKQRYAFADYLGLRLVTSALAFAGLLGAGGVAGGVVGAIALGKTFESFSDLCFGAFQQRERMDLIAKSLIAKGLLSLLALGSVLALTHSLLAAVGAFAAVSGLLAGAYDAPNARKLLGSLQPRLKPARLYSLTRLAMPLGLVYLLTSLTSNVPRYFVAHALGAQELGIFAALAYLPIAGSTLVGALGQAASPRLSRLYAAGRVQEFTRSLLKLVAAGGLIGLIGVGVSSLMGARLLTLVYRAEYAPHAGLLVQLMSAAALGYVGSLLGYGLTAAHAFKAQVPLFMLVGAVVAGVCALQVPTSGLAGAARALIFGGLVQCVGATLLLLLTLNNKREAHDC